MLRFITRRLLQMIPTLLGVIILTFVLFNVVGGSPALVKLGKNATPQALENFDEVRGFNKPLLWGTRVSTRALADHSFVAGAGPWKDVPGTEYVSGSLILSSNGAWRVPLSFPLQAEARYEWTARWRTEAPAPWTTTRIAFPGSDDPAASLCALAPGRTIQVADLKLRRLTERPFDSQFAFFLGHMVRLDFGVSSSANEPVLDILRGGIGPTLALTVPILVLETVISLALALLCAFARDRWLDRAIVIASVALMSVNYLVWIVGGQYLLAFRLGWFPVWGFASWTYLLLPVFIGAFSGLGSDVRFYRTIMLDEVYKDYVRTAFAKGLSQNAVLFRHVLKNAMIPVITNVVLSVPFLYTGSLLLESFFGIPGLGYLGVNAINDSDVDVVRAIVVIGSVLYLAANLLADLCYAAVDPRVKLS